MASALRTQPPSLSLSPEQVRAIRQAMLIGLAAFGEIERLVDAQILLDQNLAGVDLPDHVRDELRVIHPAGNANAVADFATALSYLEPPE